MSAERETSLPEHLDTRRLVLRRWEPGDGAAVYAAIRESREGHLLPWLPWARTSHRSLDDSVAFCTVARERWAKREVFWLGIFARDDGRLLGGIGLDPVSGQADRYEIGYWLRRTAAGHGYMQEAVRALTGAAFTTLDAGTIQIRCDERNTRSRHVAERCGYRYEATLRRRDDDDPDRPVLGNLLVYAMRREDYVAGGTPNQAEERQA